METICERIIQGACAGDLPLSLRGGSLYVLHFATVEDSSCSLHDELTLWDDHGCGARPTIHIIIQRDGVESSSTVSVLQLRGPGLEEQDHR